MAYGLKFISTAYGIGSVQWKIELYEKDYVPEEEETPVSLEMVGDGIRVGYDRNDDRFLNIYSRYAIIDFKATESFDINTLQFDDEKKYQVKVYRNNNIEFIGWLIPFYSSQEFEDINIAKISVQAKDGINQLKNKLFVDAHPEIANNRQSQKDIISQCLREVGYNINLEIYYNKFEESMDKTINDCPLTQTDFNIYSLEKDESTNINYFEVLERILKSHDLRISQVEGVWRILSQPELLDGEVTGRVFDYLGEYGSTKTITTDVVFHTGGMSVLANSIIRKDIPIQQYSAFYEVGVFTNILPNGKLNQFSGTTPINWTKVGSWAINEVSTILNSNGIQFDNTYTTDEGIGSKYFESSEIDITGLSSFKFTAEAYADSDIDSVKIAIILYNSTNSDYIYYVDKYGTIRENAVTAIIDKGTQDKYVTYDLSFVTNSATQYLNGVDKVKIRIYPGVRLSDGVPTKKKVKYRNLSLTGQANSYDKEFLGRLYQYKNTALTGSKVLDEYNVFYQDNIGASVSKFRNTLFLAGTDTTTVSWKRTGETTARTLLESCLVDRLALTAKFNDIFEGTLKGYIDLTKTPYLTSEDKRFLVLWCEYSLQNDYSEVVLVELDSTEIEISSKVFDRYENNKVIDVSDGVISASISGAEAYNESITSTGGTTYGIIYADGGIDAIPATSADPRASNKGLLLLGPTNAQNIELGNTANNTLVEVLGRLGIRNASNFLGEFSVADLTANRVATLPDRNIEINKWADLSGVPTSFTPSTHFHEIGEVNGLSVALADKQPLNPNLTSLGTLNTNGIVRRSGVNTFVIGTNDPITLSGDVTGTGTTSIAVTLANSGVTAGVYRNVTVNSKGLVISGTNPTTIAGYGITDFNSNWDSQWNTTKAAYINFGASIEITQNLTVNQDLYVNGAFYDTTLSSGSNNQFLRANGSGGFFWTALSTAQISNFSTNVLGQVLTGLTTGSNTPITSSNTILTGFQNLQAQISANTSAVSGTTNYIPKFTSASAIGNSTISDDGSAINVGDIAYLQDIIGGRRVNLNYPVYFGNSRMYDNTGEDGFNVLTVDTGTLELDAENVNVIGRLDISENILSLAKKKYVSSDTWYASIDALYSELLITSSKSSFVGSVGVSVIEGISGANVTANNLWNFSTIPQVSSDATLGNQLVRLSQVQTLLSGGFSVSTACKLVFIDNQSLSGSKTQGGYTTVTGDSILLTGQTSASANGVYTFDGTNWIRNTANDTDTEIRGKGHLVTNGTYASTQWVNNNSSTITVGSTAITYVQWSGSELDPVFTAHAAYNVTNTKISNWDTAYSWGNHTTLYVDKVSTQSDIGGAKTFTTSVQSPVLRAGSGSLIISLFNYFGNTPRVASSGNTLDFFANTNFTWTTTGDLTQMRLTATGLVIGGFTNDGYKLQVRGTSAFGGLINVVNPLTGSYSSGTDGQVLMRKTLSVLNYNEWTTLTVSHISDIATAYQAKITGTTNYLIKKTSTNVGDSSVYDDGTNVVIGGTSAIDSAKFSVIGKIGTTTLRVGDNTDGINIGSLAINSTGALAYGATSHTWNISSAEKLNLNSTRLALTGDFELTGRLKVGGSFGADHYFLKSNGVTQEFAEINCGEISDISDLYLSKVEADANFVKRVTDEGDRGFFLYGDTDNTIKEGFMFSNPDTGILGLHAFRLNGTAVEQYGLQLDKNGLPYWLFSDGSRKRILTENDIIGGGGSWNGGYITNDIQFGRNVDLLWGAITPPTVSNYGSRITWQNETNSLNSYNFGSNLSGMLIETAYTSDNLYIGTSNELRLKGNKYFLGNVEIDMSTFASGRYLRATSSTKAEWVV